MKDFSKLSKEELIDELILLGDENLILTAINKEQSKQLDLYVVRHGTTVLKTPKPLEWIKRDKLGIEKGTTYREPNISIRQCASWISEYIKKYCA